MATIPIIQDSEQLQTDTGRQRVQGDASAFGGTQARALGAVKQGLDKLEQVAVQKEDEANETNARELDNELVRRIRERMYNPDSGYLSTQSGQNAINGRAQAEADVDAMAAEIGSRARTPRAQAMYQQLARQRATAALGDIATHAARETRAHENDVFEAGLSEDVDSAVAAYGDIGQVQDRIIAGIGRIREMGGRRGWGDELTRQREEQFRSDVMSRVIVQLATTDPSAADELFNQMAATGVFTAQDMGELRTTMLAAQAQARELVTGAIWQAEANGQNPRALPQWAEFTTNPLFGREHEQFNEYRRQRARAAAAGDSIRDNSPAYLSALLMADRAETGEDDTFLRPGALEDFIAQNAGALSRGDMQRLIDRRSRIRAGGAVGQDTQGVAQVSGELSRLAEMAYGSRLGYGASEGAAGSRQRAVRDAFEASLARETQAWLVSHQGQRPQGEEIQIVLGRAIVGMRSADVRNMPEFRVERNRGRSGTQRRARRSDEQYALTVRPSTDAVVPYADIPPEIQARMVTLLRRRLGHNPTIGEVENAYAAMLSDMPLDTVIQAPGPR